MDPQLQAYHSSMPPHHRLHQVEQRLPPAQLSQLDRESRAWMQYHHQQQQQARGRPHPTMQQIAASRQQQMMGGVSRPPNNWAVEMEQRRVMELRQMQLAKEKELYGRASGHAVPSQVYNKGPSSKPNISLLPTAVMKHMHTSKPNQAVSHSHTCRPIIYVVLCCYFIGCRPPQDYFNKQQAGSRFVMM